MTPDLSTPSLLHRIAQLEALVGRLSEDLGNLRAAVIPPTLTSGGLAGATARGEAARIEWVKRGLVVPGEQLAQTWGLTRQALAPAVVRGEIFSVKIGNRLYYPQAFLGLGRETVATICQALRELSDSEKLMFWLHNHGAMAGQSVAAALESGTAVAKVERLAVAWARERGAERGASTA